MLKRIFRSLIAFAAIAAAYQAYVWLAVPLMEPPLVHKETTPVTAREEDTAKHGGTRYQRLLANYFAADHWSQLRPPKVIASASEQAMLVLDDYQRHEDGRVDIERFALLVFPTPSRDGDAPRDAIVLEAPQGAKLQFENFRPERGEIGRIMRGEFPGRITIRSDMKDPGPDDDLLIETAELAMNTKLLYTASPVRFRMGRNIGGGDELEIRFIDDEHVQPSDNGLKIAGIESLEIRKNVRARVFLDSESLLPGGGGEQQKSQAKDAAASRSRQSTGDREVSPVEVVCSGPFHFDFVRYVASFDRDVEMRQIRADGPSDQLSAQQMDIRFAPRAEPAGAAQPLVGDASKRQQRDISRLEPVAVVAEGHPVVVTSPIRNAEARGGRIQLGLRDRRVVISGGPEVQLTYGTNVLRAPAIDYQHPASDAATKIGQFRATGPGTLDYVFDPKKPEQIFRATWKTSVELSRQEGQPRLTLAGRPQLGVVKMGALEADRIDVYLREQTDQAGGAGVPLPGEMGAGKLEVFADRLAAVGRVEIESRQLTGNTEDLQVVFRVDQPADGQAATGSGTGGAAPTGAAAVATKSFELAAPHDQPQQAYHIDTQRLQMEVAMHGARATPLSVACDGNVLFREIPLTATSEKPLEVRGGQLRIANLDSDMHIAVSGAAADAAGGSPSGAGLAQVSARGMTLEGRVVQLDQRENRMWIDGPGKGNMLAEKGVGSLLRQGAPNGGADVPSQANADAASFPMDISWQTGLNFDGRFVVLDGDVVVQGADNWVRCDRLAARLNTPVKFGARIEQKSVDVAEIEFLGRVMLDHRSRDELGMSAHHRMQLARMTVNQQTGAISGEGPGVIRSTHFSDQTNLLGGAAAGGQANPVSPPPGVRGGKLHFLRVDFQRALAGNLYTRMIEFQDRVRTVYGPVDAWEQELDGSRLESLPPESTILSCERLQLNEDPSAVRAAANLRDAGSRPLGAVQVRANGNVQIDGQSENQGRFGARADTVSYDKVKDVMLLTGTTRAPAQVWQRRGPNDNSPPYTAREIRYVLTTGEVRLTGIPYLEYVPTETPRNAGAQATPPR